MIMALKNHQTNEKLRSITLVLLMVFSTTLAIAGTTSASQARNYTTNRDPAEIAIGDFDCDGFNDMAVATDGTHTFSILWNDGNGDFSERQDIWVAGNQSRNADWDEFANVEMIEVGEFTGDSAPDIVIYQKNNPFKTNDQGLPAGEPGNITIIENDGCNNRDWTIGARFTHFWVWDIAVGDANQDGDDDIYVLDLLSDISNQRVVTYRGPITSNTQPLTMALGASSQNTYRSIEVGDWGETQTGLSGSCTDDDIFLLRSEGLDYATGQVTNPGNNDNISIIEYSCLTQSYPVTYTFSTTGGQGTSVVNMASLGSEDFAIADMSGNGYIDIIAINDANAENVSYKVATSQGNFPSAVSQAYFGPYISWSIGVQDLNGDSEPDFVNPTIAYQQNSSDSAGGSSSTYYLNFPTTIQVTLSDGNGGHVSPLSYPAGRRPSSIAIGQLQGGTSSALDLAVGQTQYAFGGWRDNFGWQGQYDTIVVVEMDNKDLAVTDIGISPVDRFFGIVGEGTRDINVTLTNTGMDTLNGQTATLEVTLNEVDEQNSTNTTVYENNWDDPEDKSGCGTGCSWTFESYIDNTPKWRVETNHSVGASDGNNAENVSANYLNPTDFMWPGIYKTNSSGGQWSGYGKNWDEAMTLNNVDLTGADRAFMSVELFQHLGFGGLGSFDGQGFILGDVWDDLAIIEVGSDSTGWSTIACPQTANLEGACLSGISMWGGFDNDRAFKMGVWGAAPENIVYYGTAASGTYYGWNNFTEDDLGSFDLSPWAGETVDIRFRFRTGFDGSIADDNESQWTGRDGFAVDNLTIWKQNTQFMPNPQVQTTPLTLSNLQPGQEYETSIQANLINGTLYRISAELTSNTWDEQPVNDDIIGYVRPFNLFDPAIESIEGFNPGGLYAEGVFDIEAVTNNWGNTPVDFDIKATVFSATPSNVFCGTPSVICDEDFEGGAAGYLHEENQQPKGAIYNEGTCTTNIFNNYAYWFGHPCDTSTNGYEDAWANETLTIPDIDLTNMNGDFVSLNFQYFADTFYTVDQNGNIDPSDYAGMWIDYTKDGTTYEGLVYAQWNDYNEDGTCQNDDDENGIINATESIDFTELDYIGDASNIDGSGKYNVFFNTEDLVKSQSIDLTHLYVQNRSSLDPSQWRTECISLAGSTVDVQFKFQSDDDGRNGVNDGFKGVGFNNITLREFTFIEDATYSVSRTNVDADDSDTTLIGSHEFFAGVYMVQVESEFDNTTTGTAWFDTEELSEANNRERVIFNVESVDISLSKPNVLKCLEDVNYACVLPIDSSLKHSWDFQATNGVLDGDYIFHMDVHDLSDNSLVHSTTSGQAVSLTSQQRTDVSFTPDYQWQDGKTYNISFYAKLANGASTGNVRYFHAGFADSVDVAILSDTSTRTSTIRDDLQILGMTYTQYGINDWPTYFDAGWFTHYNKILLPMQEQNSADTYYEKLAADNRRTLLENYMSAGGTIQLHLGAHGSQVYGTDTAQGRLPFGMDIQSRDTPSTEITYATMDLADPYHPIMENVNTNDFEGFVVAKSVLNTISQNANEVPRVCGDYMEKGGSLQRIIRSAATPSDTVLGVCSYYDGGMIVSTIDVAIHSERADSTTFPLLGNLLQYQVTPYPEGFGILGNGLELTVNGEVPAEDPGNGYAVHYMKSDAELTFGYTTDATVPLTTDWIIEGPTSWDGSSLGDGVTGHTSESSPVMMFCDIDLASATGCAQGEQWEITLLLHDDEGHAREISMIVETNDVKADSERPVAEATIDIREDYEENIEYIGTKTVSNVDWDVHRIILDEDGEIVIHFDAGNSSDADALEGNGIESYEWKVLFDAPYGDENFDLDGHTFTQSAASNGMWSYNFKNVTVDSTGTTENQIRMELVVYDAAGKFSDKYRMYFVVVPEGFGDEPPVVNLDASLNRTKVDTDTISISGTVLSGAENGDVYVEVAFFEENFSATSVKKYEMSLDGLWAKSDGLGDQESFALSLTLDGKYSNISRDQRIFIKIYEGEFPDERWVTIKWIEISLPACQGFEAPPEALAAGGEFMLVDGECVWEGAYSYDETTGQWTAPETTTDGEDSTSGMDTTLIGAIAGVILVILLITVFVMRGGSSDEAEKFDAFASAGMYEADPVEQYVQQLVAQGYPEETARQFAQQYMGGQAQQAAAAPAQAAAQPAAAEGQSAFSPVQQAGGSYEQYYQQYYQQFISQGYDEATAAAYAQQYATQYAQQTGQL